MAVYDKRRARRDIETTHAISREEVVVEDIHAKIQRYNVPLATKPSKPRVSSAETSGDKLDFIGNCPTWCDQALVGLFGPDIAFADLVLMGQMPELRRGLPKALLKKFENGPSDAEIAFYHYRYHLASVRHSSDTRTLNSSRTRRRRIYPFVVEEYPQDPTNKLLTLTLEHPNIKLPENQQPGQPNASLIFELISALAAWAFQTNHSLAPNHSVLKILLQTQGTESEFDYIRTRLAEENMRIYAPEDEMAKARGWIGGDLKFEGVDDLEYFEDEEKVDFSLASSVQMSPHGDYSHAVLAPGRSGNSHRMDISYRSTADIAGASMKPAPSPSTSRNRSTRITKRSLDQSLLGGGPFGDKRASRKKDLSDILARSSTTRVINSPALAGGAINYPVKMDREFDQFWKGSGRTMNADDVGFLITQGNELLTEKGANEEEFVKDVPVQISFEPQAADVAINAENGSQICCIIA